MLSKSPILPASVVPGVFSTFVATVYREGGKDRIFAPFLGLHLERLAQNSAIVGWSWPSPAASAAKEIPSAESPQPLARGSKATSAERLVLGYLERGVSQASSLGEIVAGDRLICRLIRTQRLDKAQLIVSVDRYKPRWTESKPIMLHSVYQERAKPEIKSTDLQIATAASEAAAAAGCNEALLIDRNGHVREGSYSNLFWFDSDGIAWTPKSNVLPGIVRRVLIEAGAARLCDVEISLPELLDKAEVFITQSTTGITPVGQIDREPLCSGQSGPCTARIIGLFSTLVAAERERLGCPSSGLTMPIQQAPTKQPER